MGIVPFPARHDTALAGTTARLGVMVGLRASAAALRRSLRRFDPTSPWLRRGEARIGASLAQA
ncbi:MAG TPA: hypothetical protein VH228_02735 [Nocardioides sp.]|nr:hypothetical protein [Nocardioides sp.]